MADVQKENGYTAIAHELLEAICNSGFTAVELKVLLTMARYTYGFHKVETELSLGAIADFIKFKDRARISNAVARLIQMNVVQVSGTRGQTRILRINKDYDTWVTDIPKVRTISKKETVAKTATELLPKQQQECCQNSNRSVAKTATGVLPKQQPYIYKDNSKDNSKDIYMSTCCRNVNSKAEKEETELQVFEDLWKLYPKKRGKSSVSKESIKELAKAGFEKVKKAIENYKEELRKNRTDEQYIMYGSTFFNGRWKDYIDSEVKSDADPYDGVGVTL